MCWRERDEVRDGEAMRVCVCAGVRWRVRPQGCVCVGVRDGECVCVLV